MSRGRSLVAVRVSLFLYHSVFIGTYHCHGYGAVAVGVTSKEEEGGEAMGTHLECMPTRGDRRGKDGAGDRGRVHERADLRGNGEGRRSLECFMPLAAHGVYKLDSRALQHGKRGRTSMRCANLRARAAGH